MTAPVRISASFAALLAVALTAGASVATEPAALPATAMNVADPTAATDAGAGVPPDSRLLRMLSDRAAPPASVSRPPEERVAKVDPGASGTPISGVLHGCPRALLNALLAGAADTEDAVAALAIERETLELCRERQEVVNGIVALEGELQVIWAEARDTAAGLVAGAVSSTVSDPSIVKESAPVRVVSLPPTPDDAEEPPQETETAPAPPAYFWFSIIGTAGDLRAGIGDGNRIWFVREGDRLPGDVLITGIGTRPPGVHVGGAGEAALPYRPLSMDASLPARGTTSLGGTAGDGR